MISLRDMPEDSAAIPDVVDLVSRVFGESGWLVERHGLEYRPEQESMALRVAEAFRDDAPLYSKQGRALGRA